MKKKIIILLIILSVLLIHVSGIVAKKESNLQQFFPRFHKPITIEGNLEFTSDNGVVSGDGTEGNPFIIKHWVFRFTIFDIFNHNYGIYVKNTSSFFIISNCYFSFVNGQFAFVIDNSLLKTHSCGLCLENVSNGKIENCFIKGFHQAIDIINNSTNNIVYNCKCFNSYCGIGISINSTHNIIESCQTLTYGCAICCYSNAHYNEIRNCSIRRASLNIQGSSSHNLIFGCEAINLRGSGLNIYHGANNNTVKNCVFKNCKHGIRVYDESNDNTIFMNNFMKNSQNAFDECNNFWDNGTHGNYWDDYTGKDTNGDSIGDTPYLIPGDDNQDRFPSMGAYH